MLLGHFLLLVHLDLLVPGTVACLNVILELPPMVIPDNGGVVIFTHSGLPYVATGSTFEYGDVYILYVMRSERLLRAYLLKLREEQK